MSSDKPLTKLPNPPEKLSASAVGEWNRVGKILLKERKLTPQKIEAFSNLCFWQGRLQEVKEELQNSNSKSIARQGDWSDDSTNTTVLLSNVRAIQNEINKYRNQLGLEKQKDEDISNTPFIPEEVYIHLPDPIKNCCKYIEPGRCRDSFLFMSLPVIASHICKVLVEHAEGYLAPNIFTITVKDKKQSNRFIKKAVELGSVFDQYSLKKTENSYQGLALSLQSDEQAFQDAFFNNNTRGLIFEPTLEDVLESEIVGNGLYSYLSNKTLSGEQLNLYSNQQKYSIQFPLLSGALHGTFKQAKRLNDIVGKESLSRYIFYIFEDTAGWQSHRPTEDSRLLNEAVQNASEKLYLLNKILEQRSELLHVELMDTQWQMIDDTFAEKMEIINELGLPAILQDVNQFSAINSLKLAAIFSVLTHFSQDPEILSKADYINPSDSDMIGALWLMDTSVKHAIRLYQYIPETVTNKVEGERLDRFFEALPAKFSYSEAIEYADRMDIPERTARRYLSFFRKNDKVKRLKKGVYQKK